MNARSQHEYSTPRFAGRFDDGPFVGLEYETSSVQGRIESDGVFWYRPGEVVVFRLGDLALGSATGRRSITVADLAGPSGESRLRAPGVTNRAVFLQSLTMRDDSSERDAIGEDATRAASEIAETLDFDLAEAEFAERLTSAKLVADLVRRLRTGPEARNELRRVLAGIEKHTDVEIPMRDGTVLSADVFLPRHAAGPWPALMRLGVYGKAFGLGSAVTPEEALAREAQEDEWFEGDRSALPWVIRYSENLNCANSIDWVPRGYALVRVDGRGIGKSGGAVSVFSHQEADDYFDAIAWVAAQTWCDGSVGLKGSSYQSINQWPVAAMRPPALRAIAPFATDQDFYRDLVYAGGLYHSGFWRDWWPNVVLSARPGGDGPFVDFLAGVEAHPFDDAWWDSAEAPAAARLEDIDVPAMVAVSMMGIVHGRGGFEAFRRLPGEKHLVVVDAAYASYEHHDTLPEQFAFFDKHLKGIEPAEPIPPVRLLIRKGGDAVEWRRAEAWPPAGTTYVNLHLDAATGTAGPEVPASDATASYSAEPRPGEEADGAHFLTDPLTQDLLIGGHPTATVTLSSTTADADVFVSLRAFDGDHEVRYATRDDSASPISWGFLKVSHRATAENLSTAERPWHTHTAADAAPLTPGEPVQVEVELLPATALVRAGTRLRIDVTAVEPGVLGAYFEGIGRTYENYHDGATNTVHTGPTSGTSLRLPLLPLGDVTA